jgi:hypothetical protein
MILMSVFLFALSGKKILLVRRKLKAANSEFGLHRELCEGPPTRHRGFSSFGTACMSPTVSAGSGRLTLVSNITPDPFSPNFKGLEPLTPTHCREVPYSLELSPFATNASLPLDRYTSNQGLLRKRAAKFDRIYWKYAKFAFLCTLVLLITWVCCLEASSCGTPCTIFTIKPFAHNPQLPISVNRVYNNYISPNHQRYGLYLVSALTIPLHGFGNFIVYTTTSWEECRDFVTCSSNKGSRKSSSSQT